MLCEECNKDQATIGRDERTLKVSKNHQKRRFARLVLLNVMQCKPSLKDSRGMLKRLLRDKLLKRRSHERFLHHWHGCRFVRGVRAGFVGKRPDARSSAFCRPGLNNLLWGWENTAHAKQAEEDLLRLLQDVLIKFKKVSAGSASPSVTAPSSSSEDAVLLGVLQRLDERAWRNTADCWFA